ncbi:hypothetical protein ACFYWU_37400 [Streptomyces chrestomyceticus]|uniref:hypothetical protein n=1 Tax=Streptomyces chrestomyceticus TaxID=68185 RepID=UPI0036A4BF34
MRDIQEAARGRDEAAVPQRLCAAAGRGLPGDEVSLCLFTGQDCCQVLAVSEAAILRVEQVQYETAEGPGIEAAATGRPVLYPNLAKSPTPYPFFGPRLREELGPLGALYAFPLALGPHVLGTATCLRYGPLFLDTAQLAEAADVAAAAAEAVAGRCLPHLGTAAELPWRPAALIDEHWSSTYRAAGAFASVLEIPVTEALARLRARAFTTGRPLPALARDILTHLTGGPDR